QGLFEIGTDPLERRAKIHTICIPGAWLPAQPSQPIVTPMKPGIRPLEELLAARAHVKAWLDAAKREIGAFGADFEDERFLLAYSSAARHLGKASIALEAGEAERLASSGVTWPIDGWGMDELGRVLLLGPAFAALPNRAAS